MSQYNGTIVWRFITKILTIDGQTGTVTQTLPNDACGATWYRFWAGAEGIFWGCGPYDDVPGSGTMRFAKPW
jgi:hypothetical protein